MFAAMMEELESLPAVDILRKELRDLPAPPEMTPLPGGGDTVAKGSGRGGATLELAQELHSKLQSIQVRCLPPLARMRRRFEKVHKKWEAEKQRLVASRPSEQTTGGECPLCFTDRFASCTAAGTTAGGVGWHDGGEGGSGAGGRKWIEEGKARGGRRV